MGQDILRSFLKDTSGPSMNMLIKFKCCPVELVSGASNVRPNRYWLVENISNPKVRLGVLSQSVEDAALIEIMAGADEFDSTVSQISSCPLGP